MHVFIFACHTLLRWQTLCNKQAKKTVYIAFSVHFINSGVTVYTDWCTVLRIGFHVMVVRINHLLTQLLTPAWHFHQSLGWGGESLSRFITATFTVARGVRLLLFSWQNAGSQAAGQPGAIWLHIELLYNSVFHQHRISETTWNTHSNLL